MKITFNLNVISLLFHYLNDLNNKDTNANEDKASIGNSL